MEIQTRKVFFLIYDQVECLDFTGPYDVFSMANVATGKDYFELFTVSPDGGTVKALHGLGIEANYSVADCPNDDIDILVIPGGIPETVLEFGKTHPEVIEWIRKRPANVEIFATVCIGALLGAQANVFDGLGATTHQGYLDQLECLAPKARIVRGARYVDNGCESTVTSSAGVSAGIDLAFHIVERLLGSEVRRTTEVLMEYHGVSNSAYA